jgi:hypothetical protein
LACTSAATSLILSSVLTILGRPVCSSPFRLSLPCAKGLCHLNTALWAKASLPTLAWSSETFR